MDALEASMKAGGANPIDSKPLTDPGAPLAVDIDGTLTHSDFSWECMLQAVKVKPWVLFLVLIWRLSGKAYMKARLYEIAGEKVDVELLPYKQEVLALMQTYEASGQQVVLASGSDARYVNRIAAHLKLATPTHFGTAGKRNLTSSRKAATLKEAFPDGFDYVGNSSADLAVWRAARKGFGTGFGRGLESRARKVADDFEMLPDEKSARFPLIKSMRLHQWAKNFLVFTIFAITYPARGLDALLQVGIGFVLLGLVASGTYILNDLLDIEADRQHATKRKRMFASGQLSVPLGATVALMMILASHIAAYYLSPPFCGVLAIYTALTLSYSFLLKRYAVLDTFCLAGLFSLRVIAGGALIAVAPSPWLLCFMFFFFLSLALAKRQVELNRKMESSPQSRWGEVVAGRGYAVNDRGFVLAGGVGAAILSLNIFFIYSLLADLTLFSLPWLAMAAGLVLAFWLLRIWFLAARGELDDDPIYFAIKDWVSVLLGTALLVLLVV